MSKISKIKCIKHIKCADTPVYDIGVKKNSNFILANGLVVHNCKPYQYFRSTLYEKRIEMYSSKELVDELIDLERNINTGKVDHPDGGAKDAADAVCGALFNASQNAEQFAYDYGELYDTIQDVNAYSSNKEVLKKQIAVDFEEELKNISNFTYAKQEKKQNGLYKDFGFGPSKPVVYDPFVIM